MTLRRPVSSPKRLSRWINRAIPRRLGPKTFPSESSLKPMNTASRRSRIEAMLTEDPMDDFLRYSLAMEMRKEADHDASLTQLAELTKQPKPYVPAFFMAAQQLSELNRIFEARTFLRDGIEEARRQNDLHAAAEMSELLGQLGELGE